MIFPWLSIKYILQYQGYNSRESYVDCVIAHIIISTGDKEASATENPTSIGSHDYFFRPRKYYVYALLILFQSIPELTNDGVGKVYVIARRKVYAEHSLQER